MDRTRLPDPQIRVDGRGVRASSYLAYAGAYNGHPEAPQSFATHLELAPGQGPETWPEAHFAEEMPVGEERQRCLLDHLVKLRELLGAPHREPGHHRARRRRDWRWPPETAVLCSMSPTASATTASRSSRVPRRPTYDTRRLRTLGRGDIAGFRSLYPAQ